MNLSAAEASRDDGIVMTTAALSDTDRELLNAVQWDFPLEPAPYAALGARLGLSEPEVRARVAAVKEAGVLRQLSAIFDTRALGYHSSLVAAKIDPDRVDDAAAVISAHPGVSHNYKRNHAFNLWYTIAVPPDESLDEHLDVLHRTSGAIVTRKLPTLQLYKIGVKLDMTGKTAADAKVDGRGARAARAPRAHARPDALGPRGRGDPGRPGGPAARRAALRRPGRRARLLRGPRPRAAALVQGAQAHAALRRGDEPPHRGVQGERDGRVGRPRRPSRRARPDDGGFALVSHCYRRPTYSDWPYSVFTMVHGQHARDCEATIAAIHAETGVEDYALLWSVKEYKKTRVRYFTPDWDAWRAGHLADHGAAATP